jgi:hypothetical protein
VLVLYTPAARQVASKAEPRVKAGLLDLQHALAQSGVSASVRLAAFREAPGYREAPNVWDELDALQQSQAVQKERARSKADIVVLLRTDDPGHPAMDKFEGLSFACTGSPDELVTCPEAAFSVIQATCITTNDCYGYVLAHELGHVLGAGHEGDGTGRYSDSQGYNQTNGDGSCMFGTLMAYRCAPQRVRTFSDPNGKPINGHRPGTATSNNVRAVREMVPLVAEYR